MTKIKRHRELLRVAKDAQVAADNLAEEIKTAEGNIVLKLDPEMLDAEVYIERVEAMLGMLCEEYFSNIRIFNPHTPKGKEAIVLFFDENRVYAEIARSFAVDLRNSLAAIRAVTASAGVDGETTIAAN